MASTVYQLPAFLEVSTVGALQRSLIELRGTPLEIDASSVEFAGVLGLQVLQAAEETWEKDGMSFLVRARSQQFNDALQLTGVSFPDGGT